MKPLTLALLIAFSGAFACAQDPTPEPKPETEEPADPGIPADFNAYLKNKYPGLEPDGKHDLFALKDPKDKAERHEYTVAMTNLLVEYLTALEMGSTVSKLFDQYSRGKEGNQVTFKVLHAVVLLHYPPGRPNITEAQKLLLQATEQAKDYAFPWCALAGYFELPRLAQVENTSPRDALAALDKAIEIYPRYLRAVLLKCQVYSMANPPRMAEIKELIAPFVDTLPQDIQDFDDLLNVYKACHSDAEWAAKVKQLHEGGKLSVAQKLRLMRLEIRTAFAAEKFDEAIAVIEEARKLVNESRQPDEAMVLLDYLGECWVKKAQYLTRDDPQLNVAENRNSFEKWVKLAREFHEHSAEVERKHMPLVLRGLRARRCAEFLVGIGKAEDALNWLTTYLKDTDLASAQRTLLENLQRAIRNRLNPTEDGFLTEFEELVRADKMDELGRQLGLRIRALRERGEHFKTDRALKFFISQLDNRVRPTVSFTAILAADTAVRIGGEAPKQAGEAIATRFEKELELTSDEQSQLQGGLCEALRICGHRPSQERGIRHAAKLIEESKADNARALADPLRLEWQQEAFWKELKEPPPAPLPPDKTRPDRVASWLRKLADAVAKETAS